MTDRAPPYATPAEVLREEFMLALNLSDEELAHELDLPVSQVSGVLSGERRLTGDVALALSRRFNTSAEFWMRLQALYDRDVAERAGRGQS